MHDSLSPMHVAEKPLQKHAESGFGSVGNNETHLTADLVGISGSNLLGFNEQVIT